VNYFYLYSNYTQAHDAFQKWIKDHIIDTASDIISFSGMIIFQKEDRHQFISVSLHIGFENIMGMMGICDASVLLKDIDEIKTRIEHEVMFMEERTKSRKMEGNTNEM
jgi:hypothetical protein